MAGSANAGPAARRPGEDPVRLVEQMLCEAFGPRPARASVAFVGVESIAILRFDGGGETTERVYATVGMSRYPMTGPSASAIDETGPRAELVLRVRAGATADGALREGLPDVWRNLAVLAAAPAVEAAVYRPGSTVDLGQPWAAGSTWAGAVITDEASPPLDIAAWPTPVSLLRVAPATAPELAWARVHGGPALLTRWAEHGTDLLDPARASVLLS